MRFRTTILVGVLGLVIVMLAAIVSTLAVTLEARARDELRQSLDRGAETLQGLRALQRSLYRAQSQVVAQSPRLKAVVATEDISRETIVDVASELRGVVESDLFVMTDSRGQLLVDTADAQASGHNMLNLAEVATALEQGDASGIWTSERHIFQVHAQRLSFGETVVGVLVLGFENEAWIAESIFRQTGCSAIVAFDGEIVTTSDVSALGESTLTQIQDVGAWPVGEVREQTAGGVRLLARVVELPEYRGEHQLRYVLVRSLDEAMKTARRLTWMIYGIAGGVLLLALLLAVVIVRKLSRPLEQLVDHTREIGEGQLQPRLLVNPPLELQTLGDAMNRMVQELAQSREQLAAQQRLARELEIASKIQTSILPHELEVLGYEASATMLPATEVGGDYYDILPARDGFWVGIGDVAGHGLPAGLVMLMLQSCVATASMPGAPDSPATLVAKVNTILHDNIRQRLGQDEFITFTLLRMYRDGRAVYAGAHEELVIYRAATGSCELIATPGTWLGVYADIAEFTDDREFKLASGDILVLYTDGVTEARNSEGEQYGMQRLCRVVERLAGSGPDAIQRGIVDEVLAWHAQQEDDVSVVVLQRTG